HLRLHFVSLSPDLVRLALRCVRFPSGGLRRPTVFLGGAALVLEFLAELFEAAHPIPDLRIMCDEGRLRGGSGLLASLGAFSAAASFDCRVSRSLTAVAISMSFTANSREASCNCAR